MVDYTNQVTPKSRFQLPRLVKFAIAAVIALIVILVGASLLIPSNIERAAGISKKFISEFIANGDASKAYALTSSNFKTATNSSTFSTESARLHQFFTKPFKETNKKAYLYPNTWQINYDGTGKDGSYDLTTIVVKENNKFLVQRYETVKK